MRESEYGSRENKLDYKLFDLLFDISTNINVYFRKPSEVSSQMTWKFRFFGIKYLLPESNFCKFPKFGQMYKYLSRKTKRSFKSKSVSSNSDFLDLPVSGRVIPGSKR